jgi:hypothetical protein
MSIDTTSKKIIELEVELKKLKKKLSKEKSKKDDRFKLLDRRRERKGRANERLSP